MFTRPYFLFSALVIFLAATWLRFWQLESIPPGFHFDESFEGLEAWRILTEPGYRPIFLRGNFGVPVGFSYLTAGMFWFFEQFGGQAGPLAMRATAAVLGTLTIPLLMGAARELVLLGLLERRAALPVALTSGAALAGLRWHIHFSRMGIEPILGPLLWAGGLWLLLYAWRVRGAFPVRAYVAFALCGVTLAAAMYSYQAVWILPFLVAACALILLFSRQDSDQIQHESFSARLKGLAMTAVLATVLVIPLGVVFAQEPELMTTRPTQVIAGEGNNQTTWQNTVATLGMFVPFGSGDLDPRRNIPGEPALNWLWGLAFLTGAAAGLWRIRNTAWLMLWIGWIGLLLPGIFTEYAPHFHRILAASAPTAIITGVGLWYLGRGVQWVIGFMLHQPLTLHWAGAALIPFMLGATLWDNHDYFNRWAPRPDLYYAFDEGLWEIGRWSAEHGARQSAPAEDSIIFISPRGEEHPTLAFAWQTHHSQGNPQEQRIPRAPVHFDGRHIFPAIAEASAHDSIYITIEHEDFRTPLLLPDVFPQAEVVHRFTDREGEPYALAYLRAGTMEPARPPTLAAAATFEPSINLIGYDILPESIRAGEMVYIQLHWQTDSAPERDLTIFVHFVDPGNGEILAGHDAQPGQGTLPTHAWQADWLILDEHQIHLPATLPPGDYLLRAGLYPTGQPHNPIAPPTDLGSVTVQEAD